jgi:hypothetical protein
MSVHAALSKTHTFVFYAKERGHIGVGLQEVRIVSQPFSGPFRRRCYHETRRGVIMRAAKPNELKEYALPVMTARISEAELGKWFPLRFEEITDVWATPEPSKGALAKLDGGEYFVLYFGEDSKQLTLRIAPSVDPSAFLASFFREVPLPRSRVLWRRPGARLPRSVAARRVSAIDARAGNRSAAKRSPSSLTSRTKKR